MCPRKGRGKGPQTKDCCEDVKERVPPPTFFAQLLEQQLHHNCAFFVHVFENLLFTLYEPY
jgi:hypothetical protein